MLPLNRIQPSFIAAAIIFIVTFYYVYNVRQTSSGLERNLKVYKEALLVCKEKNKVFVQDAKENMDKKDTQIKLLEQENLSKHTKLGQAQTELAKLKSDLDSKNDDIKKLRQSAADHKGEIATLKESVSKSKEVVTKLSEKADHLMSEHKKLKNENTQLQEEKEKLESQNKKLESDIKLQQSERNTLDGQLSTLMKEKQDLGEKVDDLTKKNEVIQESIKQKIKESYDTQRMNNLHDLQFQTIKDAAVSNLMVAAKKNIAGNQEQKSLVNNVTQRPMVINPNINQKNIPAQTSNATWTNVAKYLVHNSESRATGGTTSPGVANSRSTTRSSIAGANTIEIRGFTDRSTSPTSESLDEEGNEDATEN